jgi:large subunit ribosomal protein L15
MRGGVGKAGGRKHFWIRTLKYEPTRYEHKGFKPPSAHLIIKTINVGELEHLLINRESNGILDLTSLGINKLLGKGTVKTPMKIKVSSYSLRAQEKIQSVGGSILE